MRTPRLILTLATGAFAATTLLPGSATAGSIHARQEHQQVRIHQGVTQGDLSRPEVRRLEQEQLRIERNRRAALADGRLSAKERARLHRQQDKASAAIAQARHN
ncbi:MAG: hypothetical protein COZ96_03620 [Nitrospirae bacterium CG_4_8_14_3_um_filter_70_85]|nr:hypothetical protein [Deltaproteobacteria bacterium]PIU79768.1 MAG: hypothetical protein COS73_02540 [Nitrospirae bacterium CG06_land_8_20_14_3_00_70_43]PIW83395.1 MAG: hypothetical protein COZ96_03620 [Nitrospirae bacterium CG_4_8_14_3_um_filter_70_85]PJB96166.1 MAG: hypothetical protein CO080_03995 [Nitrospirae bacterium CG_4_9_14_0_8_um_filter_70_14]